MAGGWGCPQAAGWVWHLVAFAPMQHGTVRLPISQRVFPAVAEEVGKIFSVTVGKNISDPWSQACLLRETFCLGAAGESLWGLGPSDGGTPCLGL